MGIRGLVWARVIDEGWMRGDEEGDLTGIRDGDPLSWSSFGRSLLTLQRVSPELSRFGQTVLTWFGNVGKCNSDRQELLKTFSRPTLSSALRTKPVPR